MEILKNVVAPLAVLLAILLATVGLLYIASNLFINIAFNVSARANDVVYICKPTSSETNPWNVIGIDKSALDTHLSNGAFLYEGEYEKNGRPHPQRSAVWCAEQVVEDEYEESEYEEDEALPIDDEAQTDEAKPDKTELPERLPVNQPEERAITNNPHGDSVTREVAEKLEQQEITEGK